ncbi:MAG: MATE family efflux transporter [Spirochaetaceae bacterium]|nr:MATE family efflux transporter [Spirochaetaceae bacterium]
MSDVVKSTTKRDIASQLWNLAYPTMIAMALQSFYDMVDMAWIGQYSQAAVSGVTIFSVLLQMFTILNEVAGASSVAMISQSFGRNDIERTKIIAEQTITFKIVLAIISAVLLSIFIKPLIRFYTSDEQVIQHALDYGWLRIFFLPLAFSSYSVNTIFRCTDDTKTPMKIMIFSGFINFVLDPIFIFDNINKLGFITLPFTIHGLGLGPFGAALATVISITISFLIGFVLLISHRKAISISIPGLLHLNKRVDFDLLRIGIPSGFNLFVRQFFMTLMMKLISQYGDVATALSGVGAKISGLALVPLFGFNMAGATIIGHHLGRNETDEAKRTAVIAACVCCILASSITLIILAFPKSILSFFFTDPEVINEGVSMVRILAVSFVPLSFTVGLQTVFSGSGHTRPLLYSTIGSTWLVQLPCLFIMVVVLHLPLVVVWFSYILAELAHFIICVYHYKKGVWLVKRV